MSAADKKKLDGIAEGANKYSLPTATSNVLGGVKTGANITNNSGVLSVTAANVRDALGYTPPKQDTNTWRPVVNNLTSSAADQSLAANQGKILNESKAAMIVLTNENLNDVVTPGFYSSGGSNSVTNKPSNVDHFGLIVIHRASGNYYTQIVYSDSAAYRRHCVNGTWSGWVQDKLTDTDTWRGIQNNLTSDSTTDSLSAAQGKALKAMVDGKAAANHTHSQYLTAHQDISGKVDKSEAGANSLLATLTTTWTAIPTDNTYFVRQDTGGGNTFGRVKFSTLWSYIKGKADATYQPKGSYAAANHTHTKEQVGLGNVDNTADANKSVKYATKAANADAAIGVVDYNATSKTIKIGYSGAGITGDAIKFIAGYTTGDDGDVSAKIKDISKDALKGWIGSLPANGGNSTTVNGHSVNSDVPAGAKFTDTNTWRDVVDNLTSAVTDKSLSANQGKVLKGLIDGKAASGHTHNYAGSSSAGGAATSANKVNAALTINLNGTSQGAWDGSSAKSISITAASVGATSVTISRW
jgi:hypothetical protein|nr:MAG TPA: Head fiber protein [Caudoviricetes sp.]